METIKNIFSAVGKGIGKAWKYSGSLPYLRVILLIILLTVVVIFFFNCGEDPSKVEQQIHQTSGEAIEQQAVTNVAVKDVKEKEAEVRATTKTASKAKDAAVKSVKKASEVRKDPQTGTSFTEANTARCVAYPESSECV